jgi:hypothetical protein
MAHQQIPYLYKANQPEGCEIKWVTGGVSERVKQGTIQSPVVRERVKFFSIFCRWLDCLVCPWRQYLLPPVLYLLHKCF